MTNPFVAPKSVLILGHGVFGLSTALSLTQRPSFKNTTITIIDRSSFPSPDGSSIDTSRIIRSDYHDSAYASLASAAQTRWRQLPPSIYSESGLVLVANKGEQGEQYVRGSFDNVRRLEPTGTIKELKDKIDIEEAVQTGGGSGSWGYINKRAGWADAEAGMKWLHRRVADSSRVFFLQAEVTSLLNSRSQQRVTGVKFRDGSTLTADLVILATGAWAGKLIDLRGRAQATGQALCYLKITDAEQAQLNNVPILLNMSTGMFIIPPRNNTLKVARHAYGYSNPVSIPNPSHPSEKITVSLPRTSFDDLHLVVPHEGQQACRKALREMIPWLADRPFSDSRICWYTDTPKGDFLITYHPEYEGLFLATGGSGHGYKFLPVIGDKIVDCIEGHCPEEFKEKWAWRTETVEEVVTEDGSRGGKPGLILEEELGKGSRL